MKKALLEFLKMFVIFGIIGFLIGISVVYIGGEQNIPHETQQKIISALAVFIFVGIAIPLLAKSKKN